MSIQRVLPGGPSAARAARDLVSALDPSLPSAVLDDLRLLVSELVTNAVRHGGEADGDPVAFSVRLTDGVARVEVGDRGPGFAPGRPAPRPDRASGWGLVLLDRLAHRWGVDVAEETTVWFELDVAAS